MLSSAPTASAPAEATLDESAQDAPTADSVNVQDTSEVEYRSSVRPVTFLISWRGTNQALRCSYGLLINGNTHTCQVT